MSVPANIFVSERTKSKNLVIKKVLSENPGTYASDRVYDYQTPEETVGLTIQFVEEVTAQTYYNAMNAPGATASITDDFGKAWSGILIGVSSPRLNGTGLWEVKVTLREEN